MSDRIDLLSDSVRRAGGIILDAMLRQPDGSYANTNDGFISSCYRIAQRLADAGLLRTNDDSPWVGFGIDPDADLKVPRTIDEARLAMCQQLHRALYGDVWARPQSPAEVWAEMLDRIDRARRQFQR